MAEGAAHGVALHARGVPVRYTRVNSLCNPRRVSPYSGQSIILAVFPTHLHLITMSPWRTLVAGGTLPQSTFGLKFKSLTPSIGRWIVSVSTPNPALTCFPIRFRNLALNRCRPIVRPHWATSTPSDERLAQKSAQVVKVETPENSSLLKEILRPCFCNFLAIFCKKTDVLFADVYLWLAILYFLVCPRPKPWT